MRVEGEGKGVRVRVADVGVGVRATTKVEVQVQVQTCLASCRKLPCRSRLRPRLRPKATAYDIHVWPEGGGCDDAACPLPDEAPWDDDEKLCTSEDKG